MYHSLSEDGTTTERTPTLLSHQFPSMGAKIDTQGLLDSKAQATSPTQIPNLDDEEEAERLRYRSWREGNAEANAVPGKRVIRSKSGDAHRIGRQIQAILPKVEGQIISSRSRKSSQYLGLFKEDSQHDMPTSTSTWERKDHPLKTHESILTPIPSPSISAQEEPDIDRHGVFEALSHGGPQFRHASTSSVSSSRSHPDLHALSMQAAKLEFSPKSPRPRTRDGAPASLLNFQLPPPAERSHLITKKKPVPDTIKGKSKNHNRHQSPTEAESDLEESDEEHISSAMYYPHRQIRPDMSPELEGTARPTISRTQSAKVASDKRDDKLTETESQRQKANSPEEVQISLESADDHQTWKADYAVETEPAVNVNDFSTTPDYDAESSVSDFESHDESTTSAGGYDSEYEGPIGSTRTPKQHPYRSQQHQEPSNPLGAVQLKPFNHQVGGHSTVYQFSRRAVCKQLNNRENVFYETVEKEHAELLEFMPR
jgi:inositol-hexakisphosphate kinase